MKYRVPLHRRVRWALLRAVEATKAVVSRCNREDYDSARFYGMVPSDGYEVNSPSFAEWLGVKWPGRPFTLYSQHLSGYDLYDYVFEMADLWWYIASGREQADECREADYQLLANAY